MNLWLIVIGMGVITYATRLSLLLLWKHIKLPSKWQQGLHYVPTAVLSAIIFPELLLPGGTLDISPGNVRLIAGLIAALIAWRTHHVLWTICGGMVALWALQTLTQASF